jgi:quercetin dioxygenase-like cupin family protein
MSTRHVVRLAADAIYETPEHFQTASDGFTRWTCVDETVPGAAHTDFGVCLLAPGGHIDGHLHSYEESFHVLEGAVVCDTPEGSVDLVAGDYGLLPIGVPHAWRNVGDVPARWADLSTPQPRASHDWDTYFVSVGGAADAESVDVRDPRTRAFGHIDPGNMDSAQQTQDRLAVSASMRTALLVYSGITVKMMVDTDLGAQLGTMFMVQYEPKGVAGAHDHPLEEAYLVLDGEVEATFEGVKYTLGPGDFGFAGVGAVHEFNNRTDTTVRWLETQAPGPPPRHAYRFARDWKYLESRLE